MATPALAAPSRTFVRAKVPTWPSPTSHDQSDAGVVRQTVEALGHRCLLIPTDLSTLAGCQRTITKTIQGLGQLDILVSNTTHQVSSENLQDVSEAQFELTYKTNIYAYFRLMKAALPHRTDHLLPRFRSE